MLSILIPGPKSLSTTAFLQHQHVDGFLLGLRVVKPQGGNLREVVGLENHLKVQDILHCQLTWSGVVILLSVLFFFSVLGCRFLFRVIELIYCPTDRECLASLFPNANCFIYCYFGFLYSTNYFVGSSGFAGTTTKKDPTPDGVDGAKRPDCSPSLYLPPSLPSTFGARHLSHHRISLVSGWFGECPLPSELYI